jgi:hypothetical protein
VAGTVAVTECAAGTHCCRDGHSSSCGCDTFSDACAPESDNFEIAACKVGDLMPACQPDETLVDACD